MLINLAEETPPGIETKGLKSTPQNFESYFASQMFGEKRQKAHQTKAMANPNTAACKNPCSTPF